MLTLLIIAITAFWLSGFLAYDWLAKKDPGWSSLCLFVGGLICTFFAIT